MIRCGMDTRPELPMCITSPERRWRAATSPLIAAVIGWILAESLQRGVRRATPPGLGPAAKIIVVCGAVIIGLSLAVLIMRTRLAVTDAGLADHRMFGVVRIPWSEIAGFEVGRPRALWGGFCVIAVR